MSTQKQNWQPLSQEQRNQLVIWQFSEDPKDRLTTGYYNQQQQLLREDYRTMVADAQKLGNWDLMDDARNAYLDGIDRLRQDYTGDMALLIRFNLADLDIWHPAEVDLMRDII